MSEEMRMPKPDDFPLLTKIEDGAASAGSGCLTAAQQEDTNNANSNRMRAKIASEHKRLYDYEVEICRELERVSHNRRVLEAIGDTWGMKL